MRAVRLCRPMWDVEIRAGSGLPTTPFDGLGDSIPGAVRLDGAIRVRGPRRTHALRFHRVAAAVLAACSSPEPTPTLALTPTTTPTSTPTPEPASAYTVVEDYLHATLRAKQRYENERLRSIIGEG